MQGAKLDAIVCIGIVILAYLLASFTYSYNAVWNHRANQIVTTSMVILPGRDLSMGTSVDCTTTRRRSRIRSLNEKRYQNKEPLLVSLETVHETIIVIAAFVIMASWVTLISLILHARVQRQMDRQFDAIFNQPVDLMEEFMHSRRHG